jgi:hypothetical protein
VVLYVYGIIPITIMRTGGCGTRLRRNENETENHSVQNSSANSTDDDSFNDKGNDDQLNKRAPNDTKDVFSINDDLSVNGLCTVEGTIGSGSGVAAPPVGSDVASTVALASFCSNSINENNHGDSTNASISSRSLVCRGGASRVIPALERSLTPVSRSETINEEK